MFSWLWSSRSAVVVDNKLLPDGTLKTLADADQPLADELKPEFPDSQGAAPGEEDWTIVCDGQSGLEDVSETEHKREQEKLQRIAEQEAEAEQERLLAIQHLVHEDVDGLQAQLSDRWADSADEQSSGSELDDNPPLLPKKHTITYAFPPPAMGNGPAVATPPAALPSSSALPYSTSTYLQILSQMPQRPATPLEVKEYDETPLVLPVERLQALHRKRPYVPDENANAVFRVGRPVPLSGWGRILRPHVEPVSQFFTLPNVPMAPQPMDLSDDSVSSVIDHRAP